MAVKKSIRKTIGEQLKNFRESRGMSAYRVATDGDIRIDQVKAVETGDANYTIDVFLGYVKGCNLYIFFSEKDENREMPHDYNDMLNKAIANAPQE
jgi:transcriptional regulator with XRE-family HTH domain